jgi:O-acetyl-ADP-ribose deacetylase
VKIVSANIVGLPVDVIVNSAHPTLMAGSGVSGTIHKAAGGELELAAQVLGPLKPGEAVTTEAFNLPAKYVIHAVAPRYLRGTDEEAATLVATYQSIANEFANIGDVHSISLPSIGTGVYGWPPEIAADIAVKELTRITDADVIIAIFGEDIKIAYEDALGRQEVNRTRTGD